MISSLHRVRLIGLGTSITSRSAHSIGVEVAGLCDGGHEGEVKAPGIVTGVTRAPFCESDAGRRRHCGAEIQEKLMNGFQDGRQILGALVSWW